MRTSTNQIKSFSDGLETTASANAVYFISLQVVRFTNANPHAESNFNVRHEWLLDDKYKNWFMKDHSGDQRLARLKVCADCDNILCLSLIITCYFIDLVQTSG